MIEKASENLYISLKESEFRSKRQEHEFLITLNSLNDDLSSHKQWSVERLHEKTNSMSILSRMFSANINLNIVH
jgi:hypothetical protein